MLWGCLQLEKRRLPHKRKKEREGAPPGFQSPRLSAGSMSWSDPGTGNGTRPSLLPSRAVTPDLTDNSNQSVAELSPHPRHHIRPLRSSWYCTRSVMEGQVFLHPFYRGDLRGLQLARLNRKVDPPHTHTHSQLLTVQNIISGGAPRGCFFQPLAASQEEMRVSSLQGGEASMPRGHFPFKRNM